MDLEANTTENIDRTVSGLKDGVAHATSGLQNAQTAMRDGVQKALKTTEELVAFNQGNLEAMARSSQALFTGMQDIGQSLAAAAKSSLEDTMNTFKAMAGLKSVKDVFELQSGLVRSVMERSVAQTGQLTESTMKLSERTLAPITARLAVATETFGRLG